MATKKANPAYRKTTRNGIPVYVSTTTGRVVKGPAGIKRSAKKLAGAVKRTVKKAVKLGVKRVKAAVKNPKGIYSGMVTAATAKARHILAAAAQDAPFPTRIMSTPTGYALKVMPKDKHRMQYLVKEWKSTKMAWENPRAKLASLTAVGKSQYKTTMDKAKALMPFPGAKVGKEGGNYFLMVPGKNVATARSILNTMAKTMTKKATTKKATK
jgi:hypothetical protein